MSDAEASRTLRMMDREIKQMPEVESVFGKNGRAETPTDPAPFGMVETTIVLKRRTSGGGDDVGQAGQRARPQAALPGLANIWWMRSRPAPRCCRPASAASSASRCSATVSKDREAAIASSGGVRGARHAQRVRRSIDRRLLHRHHSKRDEAARFGLTVGDINDVVESAIGGLKVSETVEGRQRFPINVRYARAFRDDPALLGGILVATPTGAQIPLSQVADIKTVTGPRWCARRTASSSATCSSTPTGPSGSTSRRRARLYSTCQAAVGIRLDWSASSPTWSARGEAEDRHPDHARARVLLALLNTRSLTETGIVLLAGAILADRGDLADLPARLSPSASRSGRRDRTGRARLPRPAS